MPGITTCLWRPKKGEEEKDGEIKSTFIPWDTKEKTGTSFSEKDKVTSEFLKKLRIGFTT